MIGKVTMKELLGPLYEKNLPFILGALSGKSQLFERAIPTPSGETRYSIANYYPDFVNGEVQGFFVHVADISSLKKLERELMASERKFRDFVECAPDAIVITNEQGIIQVVNTSFEKMFGSLSAEMVNVPIEKIINDAFSENQHQGLFKRLTTGYGKEYECTGIDKSGKQFSIEIRVGPIDLPEGKWFAFIIRDISLRKEAEKKLKLSEEKYRSIIENSLDAFCLTSYDGSIIDANQAAVDIFGYTQEELRKIGWKKLIDPNDPKFLEVQRQMASHGKVKGEIIAIKKGGERFPCEFSATDFTDIDGEIKTSTVFTEITMRKEAEEKLRNYSILESKAKEMEQFAYIASHDLREPLLTIIKYVELLLIESGPESDIEKHRYKKAILGAASRMEELIKGLLDYSRLSKLKQLQDVDCAEILKEIEADLSSLIVASKSTIIVTDPLPVIKAYPLELKLLFQNLIQNAIKFARKDVKPVIRIGWHKINKGWLFSVADNGIGIDRKDQEKVFIIFQKLHNKRDYPGAGIGLAQCKKIVEFHNGSIWIASTPGHGSTFNFTILTEHL